MKNILHEINGRLEIVEIINEFENTVMETVQSKRQREKGVKSKNEQSTRKLIRALVT